MADPRVILLLLGLASVASIRFSAPHGTGCAATTAQLVPLDLLCAMQCVLRNGAACAGFSLNSAAQSCQTYDVAPDIYDAGLCYFDGPPPPLPPLQPGLHPAGNENCGATQRPVGAYAVQVQLPTGSVRKDHYLVCENTPTTFRGALTGTATLRSKNCTSSGSVYAGFSGGSGPCAPPAPPCALNTTKCFAGDNQGTQPILPNGYLRYFGCRTVHNLDYVVTSVITSAEDSNAELMGITCCYAGPC